MRLGETRNGTEGELGSLGERRTVQRFPAFPRLPRLHEPYKQEATGSIPVPPTELGSSQALGATERLAAGALVS